MKLTEQEKDKIRQTFHQAAEEQAKLFISTQEQLLASVKEGEDVSHVTSMMENIMKGVTDNMIKSQSDMYKRTADMIKGGMK